MMSYRDINMQGLTASLIDMLEGDLSIQIPHGFHHIVYDFNVRDIRPDNINCIINFCNFMALTDTLKFIMENVCPSDQPYILEDRHKLHYPVPEPYASITTEVMVRRGMLKYIIRATYDKRLLPNDSVYGCCIYNHLNTLKYIHSIGGIIDRTAYNVATVNNSDECATYVSKVLKELSSMDALIFNCERMLHIT